MTNRWSRTGGALALLALLIATYVKVGEPVPWRNEFFYLVRLIRTFDPNYIPMDWTLAAGAPEHFAFNHLFGWLGKIFPLDVVGWIGRVSFWTLNLWLLMRIGRRLDLTPWGAAIALFVWIGIGQSLVGLSWILGTFEAKVVSYALVHVGILCALNGRAPWAGLAAGLAFTFHPSVGLWGGLALGGVVLYADRSIRSLAPALGLAIVGSLPGLLAVAPMLGGEHAGTADDWRLMVLVKMPHHLDPESWPLSYKALLALMLIFNTMHARATRSDAWMRLAFFQFMTFLPFIAGILFRRAEAWELLSYFPFRLFPLYTPLFFGFALVDTLTRRDSFRLPRIAMVLGVICLLVVPEPFSDYARDAMNRAAPKPLIEADMQACCEWIREEMPADAVGIAPPGRDREIWYYAERGLIVCSEFQAYHRLPQWRERVEALGGEMSVQSRRTKLFEHFAALSESELLSIVETYGPDFVITPAHYDLPLGFDGGSYRVYLPPKSGARSLRAAD